MNARIKATPTRQYIAPRNVRAMDIAIATKAAQNVEFLGRLGIGTDSSVAHAMDAIAQPLSTPSLDAAAQFLQVFMPGFVAVAMQPRKIDELIGMSTVGEWHMEEIVQGFVEQAGNAVLYSDNSNIPLANINSQFERRSIVRFEQGMQVGIQEGRVAGEQGLNMEDMKRQAVIISLEQRRNQVGFYGYNNGTNRTYGFLNDPSISAYVTLPNGASGNPLWSGKTYLEIIADLRLMMKTLRVQTKGSIDPKSTNVTLALPVAAHDYLSVVNVQGTASVQDWITTTYPKTRIISAPEMDLANGGVNAAYLYAESWGVEDASTDNSAVWVQMVPTKYMLTGVEQRAKGRVEDAVNATAGAMLKRPLAVARFSGL
ncbi:major capsid family protein [Limnohabitans sp.]|uniref:major capsid family protein n=1 Tax=Limnohabitans sp. TaxID=1907725 RepID=UPI00286F6F33|nr:major capsid family protein [Limnohabitans sp.]